MPEIQLQMRKMYDQFKEMTKRCEENIVICLIFQIKAASRGFKKCSITKHNETNKRAW